MSVFLGLFCFCIFIMVFVFLISQFDDLLLVFFVCDLLFCVHNFGVFLLYSLFLHYSCLSIYLCICNSALFENSAKILCQSFFMSIFLNVIM